MNNLYIYRFHIHALWWRYQLLEPLYCPRHM
jgi:hypothetical protein